MYGENDSDDHDDDDNNSDVCMVMIDIYLNYIIIS